MFLKEQTSSSGQGKYNKPHVNIDDHIAKKFKHLKHLAAQNI